MLNNEMPSMIESEYDKGWNACLRNVKDISKELMDLCRALEANPAAYVILQLLQDRLKTDLTPA